MYKNNTEKIEEAKKEVRQIINDLKMIRSNQSSNNQDVGLLAIIEFLVGAIKKATTPAQVKMLQLIASAARSSILLGESLKKSLATQQAKIMDTANSPEEVRENLIFALGSLALTLEKEGYTETASFLRKVQKVIKKEVDLSNKSADELRDIENRTILFVFDVRDIAQAKSTTDKNLKVFAKKRLSGFLKYLGLGKKTVLEESREDELGQDEQTGQNISNWSEEKSQDKKVGGDNMSPSTSCQPEEGLSLKPKNTLTR